MRSMSPVAARCATVSIIGVPPPTLALPRSAANRRCASSASSLPCVASSALFAVTYGVPRSSARRAQPRGPSIPPASSTTTSASSAPSGPPMATPFGSSGRSLFRTATDARAIGSGPLRTSSPRAEPTVPQPMSPMRSRSVMARGSCAGRQRRWQPPGARWLHGSGSSLRLSPVLGSGAGAPHGSAVILRARRRALARSLQGRDSGRMEAFRGRTLDPLIIGAAIIGIVGVVWLAPLMSDQLVFFGDREQTRQAAASRQAMLPAAALLLVAAAGLLSQRLRLHAPLAALPAIVAVPLQSVAPDDAYGLLAYVMTAPIALGALLSAAAPP